MAAAVATRTRVVSALVARTTLTMLGDDSAAAGSAAAFADANEDHLGRGAAATRVTAKLW